VNLLDNAVKYTPAGGAIQVRVSREGGHGVLRVRDTGVGIARDVLPRIFELFVQGEPGAIRGRSGLGIGLAVVQRLAELHGGTIDAASDGPGRGSEFIVRIPVAVAVSRRVRARSNGRPGAAAPRILVVDDNRDLANSLAMALSSRGSEVRVAYDAPEALEIAEQFRPQVVALDLSLPAMSGMDVVRQIRRQPWGGKIVFVAATGWSEDTARERALEAGFDHFLVKPIEVEQLQRLVAGSAQ